jgi:hypothetical protein
MSSPRASSRKKLTLFSALPESVLLSQLDAGFIAEPKDREELKALWENASRAYQEVSIVNRSLSYLADTEKIDDTEEHRVEKILKRVKLYPPYDTHQTGIFNVNVSKLVTPQISITESRAEERANVKPGMTLDDQLSIMFESKGEGEPINRQILGIAANGGALIFTSYNEDIRLHNPPQFRPIQINEKDTDSPSLESVCHPVGGGLPFAAAYRVSFGGPSRPSRLILSNGIHRVYSFAKAGYQRCPLAVCDLSPIEIPEQFVDLPREILLNPSQNPPLITDFLNERLVIKLNMHTLLKTIRLNWSVEQYVTVLK